MADAFSSDAVPIHLITREALALYRSKLREHGIIAFNVTNSYLDLEPVLGNLGADARMARVAQQDDGSAKDEDPTTDGSAWMVMARSTRDLRTVAPDPRGTTAGGPPAPPPGPTTTPTCPARSTYTADVEGVPALRSVPPITVKLDLFDYVPLGSPREPPPVEPRARLARSYNADEEGHEGLRLVFVAGHPVDSEDLLVLAYLWRAASEDVVWGVERWSSPERRLRSYRHDPTFEPQAAADVHAELRSLGPASVASNARALLAS